MIIIDRFEGKYAVCEENDKQILIEKEILPSNAKEGDVLEMFEGHYFINSDETEKRREEINSLQDDLWE